MYFYRQIFAFWRTVLYDKSMISKTKKGVTIFRISVVYKRSSRHDSNILKTNNKMLPYVSTFSQRSELHAYSSKCSQINLTPMVCRQHLSITH